MLLHTCTTLTAWLLLLIISITTAQNVIVSHEIFTDLDLGPVINISCIISDLPSNSTDVTVQWYRYSTLLSENTTVIGADPSRYLISGDGVNISLRNALKDDEGTYTCRVWFRQDPTTSRQFLERSDDVQVASYLPSLNYPVCSLSPVQFKCVQGSSKPQATMQLSVQYTDGTSNILHTSSGVRVTVSVDTTEAHRDAVFLCNVTSDTFPSANAQSCKAKLFTMLPISTSLLPSTENQTTEEGTSLSSSEMTTSIWPSTENQTTQGTSLSSSEMTTQGMTETLDGTTETTTKPSSIESTTQGTSQKPQGSKPTTLLATMKQLMTIKPASSVTPKYQAITRCKYNKASFVVPLVIAIIAIILVIVLFLKIWQLNKVVDSHNEDHGSKDQVAYATNPDVVEEEDLGPYRNHKMTRM